MTIAASFEIRFTRYLLPDGREAADLPSFAVDPRALVPDYRAMVFMRALDAKAVAMQRTGQIGTYASTLGKEAVDAGIGRVLRKEDVPCRAIARAACSCCGAFRRTARSSIGAATSAATSFPSRLAISLSTFRSAHSFRTLPGSPMR